MQTMPRGSLLKASAFAAAWLSGQRRAFRPVRLMPLLLLASFSTLVLSADLHAAGPKRPFLSRIFPMRGQQDRTPERPLSAPLLTPPRPALPQTSPSRKEGSQSYLDHVVGVGKGGSNDLAAGMPPPPCGACGLEDALDAPGLAWVTRGSGRPWSGCTESAFDGVDVARVGPISDNEQSWLETTVSGPGRLTFWWKVSSEAEGDYLRFFLDGVEQLRIAGEVGWQEVRLYLPPGQHGLRWIYGKNSSNAAGEDRAWLDQVEFLPSHYSPGIACRPPHLSPPCAFPARSAAS
jgi:hypothetical protein